MRKYLIGIMKQLGFMVLFLFFALELKAQTPVEDDSTDAIFKEILLEDIFITNTPLTPEEIEARKQFLILKRRVYRTYPYARIASERLEVLNRSLALLKTKKEKKKFLKIAEEYMENEFEARLKNLSRKDGQILVKLIYRQTGQTTFDLVKDLKSGWSAFWYGKMAKLYDIDMKTTYQPYTIKEDFWIEDILLEAFENRTLVAQPPKEKFDYIRLKSIWKDKLKVENGQ
ncbi:MAG: DUF4294 domain-containing protein [Flavobacteriaceae bacterium]